MKEELDEEKLKLTFEELRKFEGFENISDSECEEIIESLLKLAMVVYNLK
ncbi:hypothetical protein [Flavobacterium saliperosum]|nr:hypothetical protein [Flavobacterium saliperosum]